MGYEDNCEDHVPEELAEVEDGGGVDEKNVFLGNVCVLGATRKKWETRIANPTMGKEKKLRRIIWLK